MPMQNRWMPKRQQKKSYSPGFLRSYRCVKVNASQMMTPASQKMLPLKLVFMVRVVAVRVDPEGQRGFAIPQRTVAVLAKMQLQKLLATTNLPTPITGRKLSPQPTQQRMPQPGRQGGLLTTFSQLRMIQFTKMFLKMKQPIRQQNSTSVQPMMRIMPTAQPISRKWMEAKKFLTEFSTFVPRKSVKAYSSRSTKGYPQITRKMALMEERLSMQSLQSVGRRMQKQANRKAMRNRGMSVLATAYLVLPSPELLTMATIRVNRTQAPKNMYSLQMESMKMVSTMSMASSTTISPTKVPILTPFPSTLFSIRWQEYTIRGNFHSTQEQIRLIAIGSTSLVLVDPKTAVELEQVVSKTAETVQALVQQCEACTPTAKQSMAHMPILTTRAAMKTSHDIAQPALEGYSSLADSLLLTGCCSYSLASVQFFCCSGWLRCSVQLRISYSCGRCWGSLRPMQLWGWLYGSVSLVYIT